MGKGMKLIPAEESRAASILPSPLTPFLSLLFIAVCYSTAEGGFLCPKGAIFHPFCPLAALESSSRASLPDACQLTSEMIPLEVC